MHSTPVYSDSHSYHSYHSDHSGDDGSTSSSNSSHVHHADGDEVDAERHNLYAVGDRADLEAGNALLGESPKQHSSRRRHHRLAAEVDFPPKASPKVSLWLVRVWLLVEGAALFLAGRVAVEAVHNPGCNILFRCGCTWDWRGSWDACNVHNPTGPHCPLCAARKATVWATTDWFVTLWMVVAWACVAYRFRNQWPVLSAKAAAARLGAALAAYPVVFVGIGFLFYAFSDYPYFLWWG